MATDKNFIVKNGLEVGGQEVISSSGVVTSAALGGQTLGTTDSPTFANTTLTGSLRGPATFTIDPAAVGDNTGTLVIAGNLQVDGTTTTINSTTMEVDDLNITLASGAANAAAANGAGITVDGASATITYDSTNDEWDFNKDINVTGTVTADGLTVDGNGLIQANTGAKLEIKSTDNFINPDEVVGSLDFISADYNYTAQPIKGQISSVATHPSGTGESALFISTTETTNLRNRIKIDYNGNISFYEDTGTTAKLFWNASTESLGIGTTNPYAPLTVRGTNDQIILDLNSATNGAYSAISWNTSTSDLGSLYGAEIRGYRDAAGAWGVLAFHTRPNGEALRIDSSGNVGIGTTNPQSKLQIQNSTVGTSASTVVAGTEAGIYLEDSNTPTGRYFVSKTHNTGNGNPAGGIKFVGSPDATNYSWSGILGLNSTAGNVGELAFYTSASNSSGDSSTERMRITSSGDVGIGTDSPDAKLHLSGGGAEKIIIEQTSAPRGNYIGITEGDNLEIAADEDNLGANSTIRFRIDASEVARFNSSGDLLVGTTTAVIANASTSLGTAIGAGLIESARAGVVAQFNRQTSDGEILQLQRSGTSIGSIGVNASTLLQVSSASTGGLFLADNATNIAGFANGENAFRPAGDAFINLGKSDRRFKDLHLSGTASIGNLTIAGAQGTDGQLLTSTGSGIGWEDAPASGPSTGKAIVLSMIFG